MGEAWEVVGCEVDGCAGDIIEDGNITFGWLEVKCFFKFELVDLYDSFRLHTLHIATEWPSTGVKKFHNLLCFWRFDDWAIFTKSQTFTEAIMRIKIN